MLARTAGRTCKYAQHLTRMRLIKETKIFKTNGLQERDMSTDTFAPALIFGFDPRVGLCGESEQMFLNFTWSSRSPVSVYLYFSQCLYRFPLLTQRPNSPCAFLFAPMDADLSI